MTADIQGDFTAVLAKLDAVAQRVLAGDVGAVDAYITEMQGHPLVQGKVTLLALLKADIPQDQKDTLLNFAYASIPEDAIRMGEAVQSKLVFATLLRETEGLPEAIREMEQEAYGYLRGSLETFEYLGNNLSALHGEQQRKLSQMLGREIASYARFLHTKRERAERFAALLDVYPLETAMSEPRDNLLVSCRAGLFRHVGPATQYKFFTQVLGEHEIQYDGNTVMPFADPILQKYAANLGELRQLLNRSNGIPGLFGLEWTDIKELPGPMQA